MIDEVNLLLENLINKLMKEFKSNKDVLEEENNEKKSDENQLIEEIPEMKEANKMIKDDYSSILKTEPNVNKEFNKSMPIFQKSSSFSSDCSASSSSSSEDVSTLKEFKANIKSIKKPLCKANSYRQNYNKKCHTDTFKSKDPNYQCDKSPSIYEGKRERKIDMIDEYFFNSSKRNKYNCQDNNSHKDFNEIRNNSSLNSVTKYYSNNKSQSHKNNVYIKDKINNKLSYKKNESIHNSHCYPSFYNSSKHNSKSNSFIMHESILNNAKRTSNDTNFYFKYKKELPKFSLSSHNNSDNETDDDDANDYNEESKEETNINLNNITEEFSNESDEEDDAISIKLYSTSPKNNDNNLLFIKSNIKGKMKMDRDGNITSNSNSFNSDESIHLDSNGNSPSSSDLLTTSSSPLINLKTHDEKNDEAVKIRKK